MSNLFLMTLWLNTVELTSQMVNGTWSGGVYYEVEQYVIRKNDEYLTKQLVEGMKRDLRFINAGVSRETD